MLVANKHEQELITKFMHTTQAHVPEAKILFAERYQYDDDCYLRIGLELGREIDVDSSEIEPVQKIASALPVHPKYQLSLTFTDVCDREHALVLSFLSEKYLSPNSYDKRGVARKTFDKVFTSTHVVRGAWVYSVIFWLGALFMWFMIRILGYF